MIPHSKKSGTFAGQYKHVNATANISVHGADEANPDVNGSIVAAYEGWLTGCKVALDATDGSVLSNSCAVGFCAEDFQGVLAW